MNAPRQDSWKHSLNLVSERCSASYMRIPLLTLTLAIAYFGAFYAIRGMRGLLLSAALLGGVGVFVICFANPFQTLIASFVIGLSTLDTHLPGPVSNVLLAIVLARVLFDLLGGKQIDLGTPTFRTAMSVMILICISSLIVAQSVDYAFNELRLIFVGLATLVCLSYLVDRPSRVKIFLQAVLISFLVSIAFVSRELVTSGGLAMLGTRYAPRLSGTDFDPNAAATMSTCMFPFAVFLVSEARGFMRVLWLLVTVFLIVTVVMAASRMGLALLAMVSCLVVFRYRKLAVLAIAAAIIVATLLPEQYWTRFASLGQFGGIVVDRSLQLRQHALEVSWTMFKLHPFTGVGLGNVVAESGRYMSMPKISHNTYLAVLASLGIFGFLAFATWIGSGIGMALRSLRLARIENSPSARNMSSMILISFVALLGAFMTLDLQFHALVWWLLALANIMRQLSERGGSWDVAGSSNNDPVA